MDTSTLALSTHEGLDTAPLGRSAQIAFYSQRLERLLRLEVHDFAGLTATEANRLRGEGVMATIHALTELEAGAVASDLLRRASRRPEMAARG